MLLNIIQFYCCCGLRVSRWTCGVHGKVSGFMFAVTAYEAVLGGVPCRYCTPGAPYWNICIDSGILRVKCLALTYWRCMRVNCGLSVSSGCILPVDKTQENREYHSGYRLTIRVEIWEEHVGF